MTKLFLSIFLLTSLSSFSQTVNQRLYYLEKWHKEDSFRILKLQKQDEAIIVVINALIKDSTAKGKQIRALQVQQAKNMLSISSLATNVNALIKDSLYQKKQIDILNAQVKIVNSLQAVGSLKLTRLSGSLTYRLSIDSANAARPGELSKHKYSQVTNLEKRMAAVEKRAQAVSGNINTEGVPVKFPDKSRVIIYIKE